MTSNKRIMVALIISFLTAIVFSMFNGRDLPSAFQAGFIFAPTIAIVVAILSWSIDIAVKKGYPGWMGFLLALILNILGLLILAVLPDKAALNNNPSPKQHL